MHDYGSRGDAGFVSMLILCFSWLDDIGLLDNRYSKTSLLGHLFPNACPRVRIALYPLLDSRISYLEKCKSLLICDRTLKEIALYQLRIIELLGIESGKMVDAEELSDAALKWANMPKGPRHRVYPNDSSHAKFFRMAKNWLSDMGKYQQDEIKYPYKEEIEKYITWIGDEKGLAETTAYARRSELSGFGKYLEEKSTQETAESLGISCDSARGVLSCGINNMRRKKHRLTPYYDVWRIKSIAYKRSGFKAWQNEWESSVEYAAIKELQKQWERVKDLSFTG
jgi:hypothetical protein